MFNKLYIFKHNHCVKNLSDVVIGIVSCESGSIAQKRWIISYFCCFYYYLR